jgi:hypothetical protein
VCVLEVPTFGKDTVEGVYAGCDFEVPYRDIIEKGRWKMVKDGLSF